MAVTVSITPSDIPIPAHKPYDNQFRGYLGKFEAECLAAYILLRCIELGQWAPFTYRDLWEIDQAQKHPMGEVLIGNGLEIFETNGMLLVTDQGYEITNEFVTRLKYGPQHTN